MQRIGPAIWLSFGGWEVMVMFWIALRRKRFDVANLRDLSACRRVKQSFREDDQ
jgi:hypothetical protein